MSFSSSFTPEGVYVGAVEYGIYAALARMILIAAVSDLAVRLFFSQRPGLYLVTELSISAGMRSWFANLRLSSTWARWLQVMALFALAFLVTRGLDLLASAYTAAVQPGRMQRLAFVATANVARDARPFVLSSTIQRPYNRSDVYHALRSVVPNTMAATQWPEVAGSLTEAEVAALLVDPTTMCIRSYSPEAATGSAQLPAPPTSPFSPISQNRNASIDIEAFWHNNAPPSSLFGEQIEYFSLWLASTPGSVVGYHAFVFILPVSTQFLGADRSSSTSSSSSASISNSTAPTRQHFGIIAIPPAELLAYDLTCGLSPTDVDNWLTSHQSSSTSSKPMNPRNASVLWYADTLRYTINNRMQGVGLATSAFLYLPLDPLLQQGEIELLTFGSVLHGGSEHGLGMNTEGKLVPQIHNTTAIQAIGASERTVTVQSVLPLGPAPNRPLVKQFGCKQVQDLPEGGYMPKDLDKLSTATRTLVQRCSIDLGKHTGAGAAAGNRTASVPTQRYMHYHHGPADHGAQICKMKVRGMACVKDETISIPDTYSDLIAAVRFPSSATSSAATQNQFGSGGNTGGDRSSSAGPRTKTSCLPPTGDPPTFPFASHSNGRWGTISDRSLQAFGKSTATDSNGPQVWLMDVALLPWWELGLIASVAVLLSILGQWGDLAETMLVSMYASAFRLVPPELATAQDQEKRDGRAVNLSEGLEQLHIQGSESLQERCQVPLMTQTIRVIDLVERTQFAAIEYVGAAWAPRPSVPIAGARTAHNHFTPFMADSAHDLHGARSHPSTSEIEPPAVVIDARLVPVSWSVKPGSNLSPFCSTTLASDGGHYGGNQHMGRAMDRQQPGKEQVVGVSGLWKDVVSAVRQRYRRQG